MSGEYAQSDVCAGGEGVPNGAGDACAGGSAASGAAGAEGCCDESATGGRSGVGASAELDEWLEQLERDKQYEVVETFKESAGSKTQKVVFRGAGISGQRGPEFAEPFIRKEFTSQSDRGCAYKRLWDAQRQGKYIQGTSRIIDYFEYAGLSVCILEYVRGCTLEEYVRENVLSTQDAEEIFAQICCTLNVLHTTFEEPLLHRDIKPTNIIVSRREGGAQGGAGSCACGEGGAKVFGAGGEYAEGGTQGDASGALDCAQGGAPVNVTIIDFGIARFHRSENVPDTTQLGTPTFAPPEQYGFGQTCVESDIYALGMVLYFMLTGKLSKCALRESTEFERECPSCFKSVLLRATAFDPAARYHSALEFLDAFRQAAQAGAPSAQAAQVACAEVPSAESVAAFAQMTQAESPSAESVAATEWLSEKQPAAAFAKLKQTFGRVWNVCLIAIWVWLMVCCAIIVFFPDASHASVPFAKRALECFGCAGLFISTIVFLLFDKSRLKEKHAWARKLTLLRQVDICAIALLILCLFAWVASLV